MLEKTGRTEVHLPPLENKALFRPSNLLLISSPRIIILLPNVSPRFSNEKCSMGNLNSHQPLDCTQLKINPCNMKFTLVLCNFHILHSSPFNRTSILTLPLFSYPPFQVHPTNFTHDTWKKISEQYARKAWFLRNIFIQHARGYVMYADFGTLCGSFLSLQPCLFWGTQPTSVSTRKLSNLSINLV